MPSHRIEDLDPVVRAKAIEHERRAKSAGIDCVIRHTRRTILEQEALWAQGRESIAKIKALRKIASLYEIRSKKEYERKVTWTLWSKHQANCAYHLVLRRNGKICWDTEADINDNGISDYEEMGRIGEELGCVWGVGDPKRDLVHYEFTAGITKDELRQGKRPAQIMAIPTYREPKQQEADMTKTDKTLLIAGTVLKAVVGMNTKDKYEEKTNAPRPFKLSRRVINGTLCAASTVLALTLGINIPPEAITALMSAGSELYTVVIENKALAASVWTAVMAIVGHLKRAK